MNSIYELMRTTVNFLRHNYRCNREVELESKYNVGIQGRVFSVKKEGTDKELGLLILDSKRSIEFLDNQSNERFPVERINDLDSILNKEKS